MTSDHDESRKSTKPKKGSPKRATKTSLRSLAKRLGCAHSALHKAVHDGRLTAGVEIRGRSVVVTDPDAAARMWSNCHIVRVDEMERREAAEAAERRKVDRDRAEYVAESTAAVLIAMQLIGRGDRDAAIAELRVRFDYEVAAYCVDDEDSDALAYFDRAVQNACEWLDEVNAPDDER